MGTTVRTRTVPSVAEAEAQLWASLDATPREHRLRLPTFGTYVRVLELGHGPPVLFVHGASVAGPSWADLAVRLDGFRCLLLDRPGCGASEPLPAGTDPGSAGTAGRVLTDVLDALETPRASIVATSYGGHLALRTAIAAPRRIDRLVLLGWVLGAPHAPAPWWLRLGSLKAFAALAGLVPPSRTMVRSALRRFGLRGAVDAGQLSDEALTWVTALWRDTDTMRNELRAGRGMLSVRHGWRADLLVSDALLRTIRTPSYLLWGEDDPFGSPTAARALAERLPDAELHLLPGAGHAPWLDEPGEVAAAIRAFLAP